MSNVVVKIQKGNQLLTPSFRQCLIDLCKNEADSLSVHLKLCNDSLVISNEGGSDNSWHTLQHSAHCPFKEMDPTQQLTNENANIPVAVSVILESLDNHILLTRRPSHMRSAPNVWVPPGGHLDMGESLIECGLRELREETGICLDSGDITFKILCLWENVFPLILGFGEPKRHVLVVYYHVKCQKHHHELIDFMKINPEEVEAYAWLNVQSVAELFHQHGKASNIGKQFTWTDGKITENQLDYLKMFNRNIWSSKKFYSGVQASLHTWLQAHSALANKL